MRLVNLTPHEIKIIGENGTVTLPPSGVVARLEMSRKTFTFESPLAVNDVLIDILRTEYGEITNLPPPEPGVRFITSLIVAQRAAVVFRRFDVYSPGELVRDSAGQPIGCKGLSFPG